VDIIVCEVSLPDGDGFQILDDVAMTAGGKPEMILVTGRPNADEADRAIEMGAVGYLAKPISIRSIVGALKQSRYGVAPRALRRRPGGRACLIGLEGELELTGPDDPQLLWYTRDVSATGAFIETESPLPVGSKLDLALDIGDVRIRVTAEVVRVQEPGWGQGAGIGVSFVEFGDSAREALQGYVNAGGADTY
jgi:DNA-binding response OmpR family regulator